MKKIILRALTLKDLEKTLAWHNQDDIVEFYSGHPFPVNSEMEIKWYDKILTSNFPLTIFGIETIDSKKLIGLSMLKDINLVNRNAEFAIYIGDLEHRGKGLSKEATLLTFDFAFNKLGLNRVFLKVRIDNVKAINLYKSLGMIEEGNLRNSVFKNGVFHNELIFSILKEEFDIKYK